MVANYVAEGLRSNLALQCQNLEVERAAQALAEARARFFPQLPLEARYTRAEGGRVVDVPPGTALNPVYSTLNQLLVAQGQPARFPQISDTTTIPFLRGEEQDTRVTFRQPRELARERIPLRQRQDHRRPGAARQGRAARCRAAKARGH